MARIIKMEKKDISPRSFLILLFMIHLLPVMFADSGTIKGSSYLDPVGTPGTGYLIGKTLDF